MDLELLLVFYKPEWVRNPADDSSLATLPPMFLVLLMTKEYNQ